MSVVRIVNHVKVIVSRTERRRRWKYLGLGLEEWLWSKNVRKRQGVAFHKHKKCAQSAKVRSINKQKCRQIQKKVIEQLRAENALNQLKECQ